MCPQLWEPYTETMHETGGGPLRTKVPWPPLEGSGGRQTKAKLAKRSGNLIGGWGPPLPCLLFHHDQEEPHNLKAAKGIHLGEHGRLGLQIPAEAFRIRESELKDGDMSLSCPCSQL